MKNENLSADRAGPHEFGAVHIVGAILTTTFLWWGLWHTWTNVPGELWRGTVLALRSGAPVVRLDYMHFALPGSTVVPFIATFIFGVVILGKPLRIAPERIEKGVERMIKVGILGLIFMFPVPMLVGSAMSEYIESQGYRPCKNLFEAGFMRYRRGFVLDQRLCVPPRHLGEALRRYGYNPLPTYQ